MADEEQEAPGGGAAGGSTLKKYGPLAAIVLLAQVVLAWIVIQVTISDKVQPGDSEEPLLPEIQQQRESDDTGVSTELPYYLKRPETLGSITANPAGTNASRFVVIGVELGLTGTNADGEAFKPADIEKDAEALLLVDTNLGKMKSVILSILGKKYIDQYESEMNEIAEEIRHELNRQVFDKISWDEDGQKIIEVAEIVFTNKIIQ
jgi:flagellar basal body-associated protein FliL